MVPISRICSLAILLDCRLKKSSRPIILSAAVKIQLRENEKNALTKLKNVLQEKYELIDFRLYGSRVHGTATPESDIDVMIELEEYNPQIESEIDEVVFQLNLEHDCFISTILFGRRELEEGPLRESPIYKVIEKEGVRI